MFFKTLRTNSETKEAITIKLCTVIAYYITSITKQLKFLNSHCSIVCSYCCVMCLIAKKVSLKVKFSSSFKLNKIHIVDSTFNEGPQIYFFQGSSNFERGTAGNFDPFTNSETKEDRTIKICTVIAYYITSITKQLKFLNSRSFNCPIQVESLRLRQWRRCYGRLTCILFLSHPVLFVIVLLRAW